VSSQVAVDGLISLHVYREANRDGWPARVYLRRGEGEPSTVLALPLLGLVAGPPPTLAENEFLLSNLQVTIDAWAELNV
jgi:hypothetical protein